MSEPDLSAIPADEEGAAAEEAQKSKSKLAEEAGQASFPASDPPAVWIWEVGKSLPASPAD